MGVPVSLCLGLNLFFWTSWGASVLSNLVHDRLGLQTKISQVYWTPWGGFIVRGIELGLPNHQESFERIVEIRSLHLDPSWSSLVRGSKRFESLELRGVKGEISIEMLQAMLSQGQEQQPHEKNLVNLQPQPHSPEKETSEPLAVQKETENPSARKLPKPQQNSSQEVQLKPVVLDDFKGELVVSDVDLRLYSEKEAHFCAEIVNLAGQIPLWGEGRQGSLAIQEIRFGELNALCDVTLPVKLEQRVLRFEQSFSQIAELEINVTAAVSMARGLPFGVQIVVPAQKVAASPKIFDQSVPISMEAFQMSGQAKGYLLNPRMLSGALYAWMKDFETRDPRDHSLKRFDSGVINLRLTPSGLQATDIRLIGDQEAYLGNGYLTMAAQGAGVMRLVADPSRADSLERRFEHAGLECLFAPLVTPDREFRDLFFEVQSEGLIVDLGPSRQWISVESAIRSVFEWARQPKLPAP